MRVEGPTIRNIGKFFTLGCKPELRSQYDLEALYQRELVWGLQAKQQLIYSIFKGFLVSPIQIHTKDGGIKEEIIDGKQRLNAIGGFLANSFPTLSAINLEDKDLGEIPAGVYFCDLTPDQKEAFRSHSVPVYIVTGATNREIRLYFRLQNSGNMLNAQEVRNAIASDVRDVVADRISTHPFLKEIYMPNQKRLRRDAFAAQLLYLEFGRQLGIPDNLSKVKLDRFYHKETQETITKAEVSLTKTLDALYNAFILMINKGTFNTKNIRSISQAILLSLIHLTNERGNSISNEDAALFWIYNFFAHDKGTKLEGKMLEIQTYIGSKSDSYAAISIRTKLLEDIITEIQEVIKKS